VIYLKEVTKENYWDCINLSVKEEQKRFVASNASSIAQSKVQTECIPLGIYNENLLEGFLMYCMDQDDEEYWIYRMMIDQKYQSMGYGKKALTNLIKLIIKDKVHNKIFVGVHKENNAALEFYKRLGFKCDGRVLGKERVMRYDY